MRNGKAVAIFVRFLAKNECECAYDNDKRYFTDGKKLYKRL